MMKIPLLLAAGMYLCAAPVWATGEQVSPQTKLWHDVFAKWEIAQRVFPNRSMTEMTPLLNEGFIAAYNHILQEEYAALVPLKSLLGALRGQPEEGLLPLQTMTEQLRSNLSTLYNLLDTDVAGFLRWLTDHGLTSDVRTDVRNGLDSNLLIQTHTALLKVLFAHPNGETSYEFQHACAMRLFEHLYQGGWPTMRYAMYDRAQYPLLRFCYSNMWFYLSGNGWKHLSKSCLDQLVQLGKEGKRIIYPGGGSDVSALLEAGVPNVTVIDPQLPSQPRYYAEGWEWLIRGNAADGGIGDRLVGPAITLERIGYQEHGQFQANLAEGKKATLPLSTTTWAVRDQQDNPVGTYVFERRFANQADFATDSGKVCFISFNELYFVELPTIFGGWGIMPLYMPEDQKIYVKQLRKPVTKQELFGMRVADITNFSDFNFIALGTCVD